MKKLLVASIAAATLYSVAAFAGPPPPAPFNWSGFYVGVNGGGMDFTTKGNFFNNISPDSFRTDRKEIGIGGIHGGFQGQWDNIVVGIEGSWDAALGSGFGSLAGSGTALDCGLISTANCQARINDILSVGPRVGFAMSNWMLYGTGGYARAEIERRVIIGGGGVVGSPQDGHNNGWYFGGGAELMVSPGFIIGIEYKHYDFKSADKNNLTVSEDSTALKANADAILLRLTIK